MCWKPSKIVKAVADALKELRLSLSRFRIRIEWDGLLLELDLLLPIALIVLLLVVTLWLPSIAHALICSNTG